MDKKFEEFSKKITHWIGSPKSILVHTFFFVGIFSLIFFDITTSDILLILTTLVSLEAIYLSIFIQMTVNRHSEELGEVSEELEGVSEDIEEIQKDVEEVSEDIGEIQKDVDEIQKDVEEIEEDVGEIQKDVEEIQEDGEEIEEEKPNIIFEKIEKNLESLMIEISELKKKSKE